MICYLSLFVVLSLSLLGFLKYKFPTGMYLVGVYDILIILGIMMKMLKIGAKVNEYTDIHKGLLLNIKKNAWKAKNNYSLLMSQKYSRFLKERIFGRMLTSMNLKANKRSEYLENMVEIIDIIIGDLDHYKETRPLKLMGLRATNELIASIYVTIISVIFAILQTTYDDWQS